jgi:hypothetical protein
MINRFELLNHGISKHNAKHSSCDALVAELYLRAKCFNIAAIALPREASRFKS